MVDEQKALREEIAELRGQVIAWQKQCDTLTHQVLCCGVSASHPDATLTTRGAYAGKWNSAQAEEVRKLRAECDQMREERTAWRVTAENAEAKAAALMEIDAMRAAHGLDAARYQWLRSQNWEGNMIGVLIHPKDNARLGSFLPSEDLLDAAIDASMKDES